MSHELIPTARRLANVNVRRPRQADLKSAVSTAYYALFHTLAKECADRLQNLIMSGHKKTRRRSRCAHRKS